MGFFIGILSVPFLVVMHYTGIEEFEMPGVKDMTSILIVAGSDELFNACFLLAVCLSSPFLISMIVLSVIPLSFISDFVLGRITSVSVLQIVGTVLVIAGFVVMKISEHYEEPHHGNQEADLEESKSDDDYVRPKMEK